MSKRGAEYLPVSPGTCEFSGKEMDTKVSPSKDEGFSMINRKL